MPPIPRLPAAPSRLEKGASEPVRCLECRTEYAKPTGGGTRESNPGCPHCGYVGWVAVSAGGEVGPESVTPDSPAPDSLTRESPRVRSDADPQWLRLAQRR